MRLVPGGACHHTGFGPRCCFKRPATPWRAQAVSQPEGGGDDTKLRTDKARPTWASGGSSPKGSCLLPVVPLRADQEEGPKIHRAGMAGGSLSLGTRTFTRSSAAHRRKKTAGASERLCEGKGQEGVHRSTGSMLESRCSICCRSRIGLWGI